MKDDFYGKKQPFRSPWWLIGAAVLLIAVAAALLWPSESLAPAQEEQTQSAAADQAARLEDGAELVTVVLTGEWGQELACFPVEFSGERLVLTYTQGGGAAVQTEEAPRTQ